LPSLALECFGDADFEAGLFVQFLLVHCSLIISEPQVQNSAKYITPFIYLNISQNRKINNSFGK
jgi:hypothetical protein